MGIQKKIGFLLLLLTAITTESWAQNPPWANGGNPNSTNGKVGVTANGFVTLSSNELNIQTAGPVEIIRTVKTPKEVKVHKKYNYTKKECVKKETRMVFGPNRRYCGEYYPVVCGPFGGVYQCRQDNFPQPRSCNYPVERCVQKDVITYQNTKTVIIDFSDAYELWGGQTDTFLLDETETKKSKAKFILAAKATVGPYKIDRGKKFLFWGNKNKFTVKKIEGHDPQAAPKPVQGETTKTDVDCDENASELVETPKSGETSEKTEGEKSESSETTKDKKTCDVDSEEKTDETSKEDEDEELDDDLGANSVDEDLAG